MTVATRISQIEIDDSNLPAPTPEIEQERKVAVFDLLEDNSFAPVGREGREVPPGPYHLHLAIREKRLVFDVATEGGEQVAEFHLSLSPCPPRRSRRSTWHGAASTTRARASCRNAWKARPIPISTRRGACSPLSASCITGADRVGEGLPQSVLFCCDHNAVRSPMAEGIMKKLYGPSVYVQSVGVKNDLEIDGFAVAVCQEIGVELSRHRARSFDELREWGDDLSSFDLVIALTPASQRQVLELTRVFHLDVEYWPIMDPSGLGETRDDKLATYRQVRDQIRSRLLDRFGPPVQRA